MHGQKLALGIGFLLVFGGTRPSPGALITGLVKTGGDTAAPDPVIVTNGLFDGVLAYVDRIFTWEDVPLALLGSDYIRTENDDKNLGVVGEVYSVTVGTAAFLHVFIDQRLAAPPTWVTDGSVAPFVLSGTIILRDESSIGLGLLPNDIYTAQVAAGTYNLLEQTGASMYGIAVSPIPEPTSIALLTLGLGALGFVRRRKKKVPSEA